MQRTQNTHAVLVAFVALSLISVAGCNKTTDSASRSTASDSPTPAASPLDARIQSLADEQTKGREADALKQAEAMKKLNQK